MLIERENSLLILVDLQEKLTPLVLHAKSLIENCDWMLSLAQDLKVKYLVSEQYSQGLGPTVAPLRLKGAADFDKVHFSCFKHKKFADTLKEINKNQIILMGIETHVCVLQTAIDLKMQGYEVFVIVDAVSARYEIDHHYGLKRLKQHQVELVTREMIFFEWFQQADSAEFKALSKQYLTKRT